MATLKRKGPNPHELAAVWETKLAALKAAQAEEMNARLALAALIPAAHEGSNTLAVDDTLKIRVNVKVNYTIDEATLSAVLKELPADFETRVIRYKPDLRMAAYRALPQSEADIFAAAVTARPGTPSVEVIHPDAPKPTTKRK